MLSSVRTLGAAQLARSTAPLARTGENALHLAALEGVRQRNAVLDALFYDVKVVGRDEAVSISPWLAREGAILVVPPSGAGSLQLCQSVEDYLERGGGHVRTLVVAGVGSSALGSAAFARNVADARGATVAAVVSGYGLADLATEALGGFFLFGALNGLRHAFQGLDRLFRYADAAPRTAANEDLVVRESRDTATTFELLNDRRLQFDLLVGHSKGNLVLSEALFELTEREPGRATALAATATMVTISAKIAMPRPFRRIIDVMGALDWFGAFNSRPDIRTDHVVPGAWHHTNTELPMHLPVTGTLRQLGLPVA